MAMNMRQAFAHEFMTRLVRYRVQPGTFDEFNEWQEGSNERKKITGVIKSGNKFSQFDEGISLQSTESGDRYSDYRTLYITKRYDLEMEDKILYQGKYYNVLQQSPEDTFWFKEFLLEADKNWRPENV